MDILVQPKSECYKSTDSIDKICCIYKSAHALPILCNHEDRSPNVPHPLEDLLVLSIQDGQSMFPLDSAHVKVENLSCFLICFHTSSHMKIWIVGVHIEKHHFGPWKGIKS